LSRLGSTYSTEPERLTQTRILGVRVDCLDMTAALAQIERFVDEGGPHLVATVNPEFVMQAQKDREFARVLQDADLCLPDGVGVVWAARRQGCDMRGPVAGVDLVQPLAACSARRRAWPRTWRRGCARPTKVWR